MKHTSPQKEHTFAQLEKILFCPKLPIKMYSDLQSNWENGVYGNVYLLDLDNTKR